MNAKDTLAFIDDIVNDFKKIQKVLLTEEPTTAQNISVHLTKIYILSCTSYYEQKLQDAYLSYAKKESDIYAERPHPFDNAKNEKSVYQKFSFGRIEDSKDTNDLPNIKNLLEPLKYFGEQFRDKIFNEINGNSEKEKQLKDFQEMFVIRNLIAHQTFIEFNHSNIRNKSFLDIEMMHKDATKFVDYLCAQFV